MKKFRTRFSKKTIPPARIKRMRDAFFRKAGPAIQLLCDLLENTPSIALVVKDAEENDYSAKFSLKTMSGNLILTNRAANGMVLYVR